MKEELKKTLEGMVTELFGDVEMRWVEAYFPFTEPSLELEIFFNVCIGIYRSECVGNTALISVL